jgi:hypothetical protein
MWFKPFDFGMSLPSARCPSCVAPDALVGVGRRHVLEHGSGSSIRKPHHQRPYRVTPDLGVVVVQRSFPQRRYGVDATSGALARVTPQGVHRMTAYPRHGIVRGAHERIRVSVIVVVVEQHDRLPTDGRVTVIDRSAGDQVEGELAIRLVSHAVDLMSR